MSMECDQEDDTRPFCTRFYICPTCKSRGFILCPDDKSLLHKLLIKECPDCNS